MHSGMDDPNGPGFPIRTSQDHCLVTSSPGLFAGSDVLHRLLTPRHPPHALGDLTTPTAARLDHYFRDGSRCRTKASCSTVSSASWQGHIRSDLQVTWPLKTFSVFNTRAQDRKKNARVSRLCTRIGNEHRRTGLDQQAGRPSGRFHVLWGRSRRISKSTGLSRPSEAQSGTNLQFFLTHVSHQAPAHPPPG